MKDTQKLKYNVQALHTLLEELNIDTSDEDVQQMILNCAVVIDNTYHNYALST